MHGLVYVGQPGSDVNIQDRGKQQRVWHKWETKKVRWQIVFLQLVRTLYSTVQIGFFAGYW